MACAAPTKMDRMEGIERTDLSNKAKKDNRINKKTRKEIEALGLLEDIKNSLVRLGNIERKEEEVKRLISVVVKVQEVLKEEEKEEIKGALSGQERVKEKRTWADITRGNPSILLPSSTTPSVDRNIYYRLSKEQGEEASRLTPSQLIQRIQEEGNGWQAAIAVKTTKESILLTFSSLAAKQLLVGK